MNWDAIISEHGFLGGAVILLCYTIWWLVKWIRQIVDARQQDAERFAQRSLEREREMLTSINELTGAIRGWSQRDNDR